LALDSGLQWSVHAGGTGLVGRERSFLGRSGYSELGSTYLELLPVPWLLRALPPHQMEAPLFLGLILGVLERSRYFLWARGAPECTGAGVLLPCRVPDTSCQGHVAQPLTRVRPH